MSAGHRSSAAPLAALYAALIAYATLSPFTGWRLPAGLPWLGIGHMPWPRYWTTFDVVANFLGYIPLGALIFGALLRGGRRPWVAALWGVLLPALLSFALESLQNWLPRRVPSGMDWVTNAGGGLVGVLLAWSLHWLGVISWWQRLRDRWFIDHSAGAIALLLLWPVGLLFPTPVPFGLGQVLMRVQQAAVDLLQDTPWADSADAWLSAQTVLTPLSPLGELMVISFGLLAPSLVAYAVVPPGWRRLLWPIGAVALGFGATTLSTAMNFGPQHALTWITSPVAPGMVVGVLVGLMLWWVPRRMAAALGLMAITTLVVMVARAPSDPYFAQSLLSWEQGRFIRFHGAAQWVGWLWPYVAMAYLLGRVVARDSVVGPPTPR